MFTRLWTDQIEGCVQIAAQHAVLRQGTMQAEHGRFANRFLRRVCTFLVPCALGVDDLTHRHLVRISASSFYIPSTWQYCCCWISVRILMLCSCSASVGLGIQRKPRRVPAAKWRRVMHTCTSIAMVVVMASFGLRS